MRNIEIKFIALFLIFNATISCQKEIYVTEDNIDSTYEDTDFTTDDWTTETHSSDAQPNFNKIFDDNQVKRIDIVVTSERWQSMLDDMTDNYGAFGTSSSGSPGGGPGGVPGGDPNVNVSDNTPIYVPAEVFYNNKEWYRVGIRFKGNSSLKSSWQQGTMKLSFKLDFDEFEDVYPQIANQRFYGFKKLSLKNNYDDKSFIREKVSSEIFRNAGLAVSHTAFYTLYVDYGEGPVYFGLYTLVEEVDNTVIKTQYSSNACNLYKPENTGASFASGTLKESDFVKKTNEDASDWSEIENLFSILHDNSRTSDPEKWRSNLDSVFNTDVFLKYLAVNTIIQNWDTYGVMQHNYFLYNNPDNNKLEWIPWDNNEALQSGKMGGALLLNFSNLETSRWPLIEYLYNDEYYKAIYDENLREIISTVFEPSTMKSLYANYASLIEPYATTELDGYTFLQNSSDFQQAITQLNQHVENRKTAVENYLAK